ncbi:MAG TPA: hypothetical protein VG983_01045 [Caulobacterales bacterium]|nr:hypothetical protein [Caulobacterales bacterium]
MASAVTTTSHEKIRAWVEENNGRPARVEGTGGRDDPGMLRIDFDERDERLAPIGWEEWFEAFERNRLALLHAQDSRFNKLVSRDGEAEEDP